MEIREAPLDTNVIPNNNNNNIINYINNYMITVNISPNKFVNNKHWKSYSIVEQDQILEKSMKHVINTFTIADYLYRFESTKQGMRHLHFVCDTTEDEVQEVQKYFHKRFGMPSLDPSVCCTITKTFKDVIHAVLYTTKEDNLQNKKYDQHGYEDYDDEICLFTSNKKK